MPQPGNPVVAGSRRARATFGLDAPGIVRGFLVAAAAALVVFLVARRMAPARPVFGSIAGTAAVTAGIFVLTALAMIWSSRAGKHRAIARMLDGIPLAGSELVLDVGCGRGALLLAVARRLTGGTAVGVDIWSRRDQAGNSRAAALVNAELEGVAERVRVEDADMRSLPFADATFDAVVSSLAVHNVRPRAERERALREMVRVLRPGGRIAIMDIAHADEYARTLVAAGLDDVHASAPSFWTYPPSWRVTGVKPAR